MSVTATPERATILRTSELLGRLNPGVTRPRARAEVQLIAAALDREPTRPGNAPQVSLASLNDSRGSVWFIAATLLTTVGLVVLLACANIANALLASAVVRRREIGTRLALGASRRRVVRQLITESVLLGLVAGVPGLLAAWAMTPAIASLVGVPPSYDVSVDLSAVVFVALVAVLSGVAAGLRDCRAGTCETSGDGRSYPTAQAGIVFWKPAAGRHRPAAGADR